MVQEDSREAEFPEGPHHVRVGRNYELHKLLPDALGADFVEGFRLLLHDPFRFRVYFKSEAGRKAGRAEYTQCVF